MVHGAFPTEVGQDEEPHVDPILDEPAEADAAWEEWTVQQVPAPPADHPQVAVSAQMSGVSNQPTSDSTNTSVKGKSKAVHSPIAESSYKSLRPHNTIVYKRRASPTDYVARRSSADCSSAGPSRLELPAEPTLQDFAQASLAAQVSADELQRDHSADTRLALALDAPADAHAAEQYQ
ncbi:hypothetical protein GUJ93_ZPchr0001g29962 [Zizania palustris]|uniref:Uncharacterized protein n=1 Tax=Zizania palustris TaxID=103762 RepID=A0A8J5RWF3_ZIZPA|nr:hypothetical protein GUJ93_ZPchr0001g29962 [Zizania palustris]